MKHPDLYRYETNHIDPGLRGESPLDAVTEVAEQIYRFKLFTSDYCRRLVDEAEAHGGWITQTAVEFSAFVRDETEPDTTLDLSAFPGLPSVYRTVVDRHIRPLIERLWTTFRVQLIDPPYLLKYQPGGVDRMALHHDIETVSMIVYLNTEFEGGGTRFPRFDYETGSPAPGTAIL